MLHILECSIFYFIFLEEKLVRLLSTLAHHVFHIVFVLNVVCSQLKNYIFIMFSCFILLCLIVQLMLVQLYTMHLKYKVKII